MSRGRPPRMACREACASAALRGAVLDAAGVAMSRIDFILFIGQRLSFVRVKRSHSRILAPAELSSRFSSEIAGLRKVPLTPVVSRELWVLLPWGTWQHFCVGDDTVTEIHEDTGKISGTHKDPVMMDTRKISVMQQDAVLVDTGKIPGMQQDPEKIPGQRDSVPAGGGEPAGCSPGPEITGPDVPLSQEIRSP